MWVVYTKPEHGQEYSYYESVVVTPLRTKIALYLTIRHEVNSIIVKQARLSASSKQEYYISNVLWFTGRSYYYSLHKEHIGNTASTFLSVVLVQCPRV